MNRIILRFLIPYLLILAIPLMLGGIIFTQSIRLSEREVASANLKLLDQSMRIMEGRLSEMKSIGRQIASNPKIAHFQQMANPFDGSNVNRILDVRRELTDYLLNSDFLFTYFVIYQKSGLVMTGESTYPTEAYYGDVLSFTDVPYQQWYDQIFGQYHQSAFFPAQDAAYQGKQYSFLTFAQSMGDPGFSQGGVVVGLIDNRKIQDLLKEFDFSQGGWAYIADEKGAIISSYTSDPDPDGLKVQTNPLQGENGITEQKIGSERMLITHTTSGANGWSYVVAQPKAIVMSKVNFIRRWTECTAAAILLFGILLAYLLAYKTSQPVKALVESAQRLDYDIRPKNVFQLIHAAFTQLAYKHDELKETINRQIPVLRIDYLNRLFRGEFRHENELEMLFSEKGLIIAGNTFTVGLLQFGEPIVKFPANAILQEASTRTAAMAKELESRIAGDGYVLPVGEKRLAILFVLPTGDALALKEKIRQMIGNMEAEIAGSFHCSSYWGIGCTYERLVDVARSSEEAKFALQHAAFTKERTAAWYGEHPQELNMHFYPGDWEIRLIHAAQSGSAHDAGRILEQIYRANFVDRQLSLSMLRVLYYDMLGTVAKLSESDLFAESGIRQQWVSLLDAGHPESYDDYERMYDVLQQLLIGMCAYADQRKKSRNDRLKQEMLAFVDKQYNRPDMGLAVVAEAFDLSEIYVSQFFKEQSGSNFSDYLEEKRMKEARRLLADTSMTINDISAQTGYASFNTFCRAFKRIHGLSATSYRKTAKGTIVPL